MYIHTCFEVKKIVYLGKLLWWYSECVTSILTDESILMKLKNIKMKYT